MVMFFRNIGQQIKVYCLGKGYSNVLKLATPSKVRFLILQHLRMFSNYVISQRAFACSKLTVETPEKSV